MMLSDCKQWKIIQCCYFSIIFQTLCTNHPFLNLCLLFSLANFGHRKLRKLKNKWLGLMADYSCWSNSKIYLKFGRLTRNTIFFQRRTQNHPWAEGPRMVLCPSWFIIFGLPKNLCTYQVIFQTSSRGWSTSQK